MNRRERLYKNIERLVGMDLKDFVRDGCYIRYEAGEGFMPLSIEALEYDATGKHEMGRIAMVHWWEHPSGDLMRDPDMEILIYPELKIALPMRIRQDPYYEKTAIFFKNGQLYMDKIEEADQERFLDQWLKNIKNQGYEVVRKECFK